ncbi:ATP-binding protein [Candidatus Saccharibacteria bacterium]|nr:ATP-binding protein [Candidatus Saccharibacteria bacterium]
MIERPLYLKQIEPFIDKPMIKILVGIRRAGKSSILKQVESILVERGVKEKQIININFEALEFSKIRVREEMIDLMTELTKGKGKYYILLDEVQLVEGWDEVVNGLLADGKSDIYITGSNSKLLSSELSTYLTGRYVEIQVYPLSFSEALEFKKAQGIEIGDLKNEFDEYMNKGGFPILHAFDYQLSDGDKAVEDIYTSIVYRDLIERKKIRNTELLGRVIEFLFDNIGNIFSAKSVSDYFKSELRKVDPETVYNYIELLKEVFVIYEVKRYDLRGKALLKTQEKYYLGDVGLLYALSGRKDSYKNGVLENLVFLELISKGYNVHIGKNQDKEIDFVAEKKGKKFYLQIAIEASSEAAREREFGAFNGIDDNYPKYVLTLENGNGDEQDGITKRYLPEFLLEL